MKIKDIEIINVGGISNILLTEINTQINIICGENGVGKTNILDSIASCFSQYEKNIVSKKSGSVNGIIKINAVQNHEPKVVCFDVKIDNFEPSEYDHYINNILYDENKHLLLYLKTNRGINYKKVSAINADPDITHRSRNNSSGISNEDIKEWLLNRILHSKHDNHLSETQLKNLELSKDCFSILNSLYKYSRLDTKNELFLESPTGEIYFEYLSSGFKSTVFILLGIIKEIDYRFEQNRIAAVD